MTSYAKTGKTFMAYAGNDISLDEIERRMMRKNRGTSDYRVKTKRDGNRIFSKITYSEYQNDRDPYYDDNTSCTFVSGYNQDDLRRVIERYQYDITDSDRYHTVLAKLYDDHGPNMFKKLQDMNVHVSTVFQLPDSGDLVAGVTTADGPYTHLYYGFTNEHDEIVFSNNEDMLTEICHDIKEMEPNTYMIKGVIYNFDGREIGTALKGNQQLIRNSRENAESLIGGLNQLLIQVTNDAVRDKIEKNVDDYLNSTDPKKKILDFLVKELDTETQKQILNLIKTSIESNNLEEQIGEQLTDIFEQKIGEYAKSVSVPIIHVVKLKDTVLGKTKGGFFHEKFDEILEGVQLDEPVMLIGPAGSGKNHTVQQVADALGLHMYYTNNASNEFKLTGFIDAGGTYRETEFYRAFKNGGLFNLDEVDTSDPSALIVINSALANGYMAFPHETIDRHKDFRIVTAANTWGKGADMQYVGRNALDGATLDRFDNIYMDYDRKLEGNLFPNDEVLKFMWAFRDAVTKSQIHHIVSTRGIGKVYKKEVNGIPVERTLRENVVRNLSQDDVNTIIGNMENINTSNKYYDGLKKLVLTRR